MNNHTIQVGHYMAVQTHQVRRRQAHHGGSRKTRRFMIQGKRHIAGQAIVEMLLGVTLLVPVLLVITLLAQFLDIQYKTHESSRYAAWERTIWAEKPETAEVAGNNVKSAGELHDEVDVLFFRSARMPVHFKSLQDNTRSENPLWRSSEGESLLAETGDKGAKGHYRESTVDTPAKNVMDMMGQTSLDGRQYGLKAIRRKNYSQISVERALIDLNLPLFGTLNRKTSASKREPAMLSNLAMRSDAAILSQAWMATDEDTMGQVIGDMVLDGDILKYAGESMGYLIYEIVEMIPSSNFPFKDLIPAYLNKARLVPENQSLILPNYAIKGRTAPLKQIGVDIEDIMKWI